MGLWYQNDLLIFINGRISFWILMVKNCEITSSLSSLLVISTNKQKLTKVFETRIFECSINGVIAKISTRIII